MTSSLKQSIYTLVFLLKFVENVPDSALPTNIYYRALEDGDRSLPPTFSPVFAYPTGFLGFTPQQKSPVSTVQNNKRLCRTCSCGLMNTSRRIVGGQETEKYEYPWVAMLIAYNKAYCGATLINRNYVITAAHCVLSQRISALTVRLLSHRRTPIDRTAIDLKISKLIPHRGFNYNNYADDIALVKLWPPAPLSNILLPVCLPDPRKPFNPKMGVVVGWGNTVENGRVSNSLREVAVPILPEKECRSKSSLITDNMLCAGEEMGGKDACQGDSGGPLLFLDGVEFAIGGIVSWGEGCARPNKPGVYTKVSKYYNWIMQNTNDSCYCSRLSELQ